MSFLLKTNPRNAIKLGKKIAHSKEFSFVKKNIGNKRFYHNLGKKITSTDYKHLVSNPKTYRTIAKGLDKADKIQQNIGTEIDKVNPKAGLMYKETVPVDAISYGLQKGARISKRIGRTLEREKKAKSNLEKGLVLGQSAVSIGREFL